MKCPNCDSAVTDVRDSRPAAEGAEVRRRRSCPVCRHRFSTYEAPESLIAAVRRKLALTRKERDAALQAVKALARGRSGPQGDDQS